MSIRVYFVRHGQSESNMSNNYYNDESVGLTNLGKVQAAKVGYRLKDYGVSFSAIFCSPYRRAIDTCQIALRKAGMQNALAVIDERLGERKFDGLIGQEVTDERNRGLYRYDSNQSAVDGVEPLEALEARAQDFINEIVENYCDGNILVFSHSAFGLAFRAVVQGRPKTGDLYDWDLLKNGEMMILEI